MIFFLPALQPHCVRDFVELVSKSDLFSRVYRNLTLTLLAWFSWILTQFAIAERTMNLLMSSSERYSRPTEKTPKYYSPPDTPIDSIESLVNDVFGGTCYVCNRVPSPSSEMTCNFCSNTCCDTCARQCESCGYIYCSFCSTVK